MEEQVGVILRDICSLSSTPFIVTSEGEPIFLTTKPEECPKKIDELEEKESKKYNNKI